MGKLLTRTYHYFGMDLPKRVLPLNFTFPKISGRFKASHSGGGSFLRELDEVKDAPLEYFRLLLGEIKHINRCTIKHKLRLSFTRQILKLYYPKALEQIARHSAGGGIPDTENRQQILDMIAEIAQIMAISFQILFAEYYGSSNFRYARVRNTVQECALRILELLALKQQIKALRYQLLSEHDWKLANTIFHVMSCYEDIDKQTATLSKGLDVGRRSDSSLSEQFALLQTVAKFDMLRWPTHLQWVIGSYFHSIKNAVQVKADDGSCKLGRNDLVVYCYDSVPARNGRMEAPFGNALILAYQGMADAIRKDCMGMSLSRKKNDPSIMPPRLARFPDTEHFVISDQLVRGLESATDDAVVVKQQKVEDLRIFVGFIEVFNLLLHQSGMYKSEDRLEDMLAKRSALIAEDNVATEKSLWTMLFKNEKMMRLSTQETSFTKPMAIGALLAYGVGEDIGRPRFASVSRILRPSHKVVEIDMKRIAGYAEPVRITVNTSDKTKPALLVYDKHLLGGWGLLFPPQDVVPGIDKIYMYRNNQKYDVNLESMRNATPDFYLFSTSILSEQLGMDKDPGYAAATI